MKTWFLPPLARNCSAAWIQGVFTKDLVPTMLLSHPPTSYSPLLAPPWASHASPTHTAERERGGFTKDCKPGLQIAPDVKTKWVAGFPKSTPTRGKVEVLPTQPRYCQLAHLVLQLAALVGGTESGERRDAFP